MTGIVSRAVQQKGSETLKSSVSHHVFGRISEWAVQDQASLCSSMDFNSFMSSDEVLCGKQAKQAYENSARVLNHDCLQCCVM